MTPQRIQLSRRHGFRLQQVSRDLNGLLAVKVDRGTEYGNPSPVGPYTLDESLEIFEKEYLPDVVNFDPHFLDPLRGKNLACWCPPGQRCHADILLREANK